jgi:hypothetical protein
LAKEFKGKIDLDIRDVDVERHLAAAIARN